MRYDTPVYLQTKTQGRLDPNTGNYLPALVRENLVYGSVSANDANTNKVYYGGLNWKSVTIHFNRHLPPFDTIRIGSVRYRVDSVEQLRTKTVVIASEVK